MFKNIDNLLASCNNRMSLISYDFKFEDPSEEVRTERDILTRFFKYKASNSTFDCDSCELTDSIYKKLWGWSYKSRYELPNSLNMFKGQWDRFGSDTMNSFL